jgi:glycosyltransferase involved in cell wall biosynthesis
MNPYKQPLARLKLLILINWREDGQWTFLGLVRNKVLRIDLLQPLSFRYPICDRLIHLFDYWSDFYLPVLAMFRKRPYDLIISWQMRLGICYGILKRFTHSGKSPVHVIQDFHIDLTQERRLYGFHLALLKLAIPGIDFFFCTSTEEEHIYSQMFGIDRHQIAFLPLIAPQSYLEEPNRPIKDYIFSYGNSDRDFDVLIRAAARVDIRVYVLSKQYRPGNRVPENVTIIGERVPEKELIAWIASSRMVVLPLKDYRISAGQLSMLEVMALARPLIITENMATKEYAVHRQSALFFKAGDDGELADRIRTLLNDREAAEQMGQQAREAAQEFSHKRMAIFTHLLERCTMEIQKGELP